MKNLFLLFSLLTFGNFVGATSTLNQVLIVGIAPESVDLKDPSLPKGLTAADIQKGLEAAQKEIAANGNHGDLCMIKPDLSSEATVRKCLAQKKYDCVVIGSGIRVPVPNFQLFETLLNVIHQEAPSAVIALNANAKDSAASSVRALKNYKH